MSGPRVGIIGAGQLGRMLALAAWPLGVQCRFLDTSASSPGGQVAPIQVAALDDAAAVAALAREVDVLTFDIENVSAALLESVSSIVPVHPAPGIVALGQDRLAEKRLLAALGMPTAPHHAIDSAADLAAAAERLGWPIVLKARRLGYDGRGQRIANSAAELASAWDGLGRPAAIAEGWVAFEREVSLIGARGAADEIRFYPLTENRHRDGQLDLSIAPCPDSALQAQAESWMRAMLRQHDYRGVLTIEFFQTTNGLVANEIAPRVHNSGHWTIEGAETSQFENHLRAILGLPLGSTATRGVVAMKNLIGRMPRREDLLAIDGLHLHDYGKEPRPGRKLGHVTLLDRDRSALSARLETLEACLGSLAARGSAAGGA
jgi:5-(carboxyamino)imidazole ribonucleotide synthase